MNEIRQVHGAAPRSAVTGAYVASGEKQRVVAEVIGILMPAALARDTVFAWLHSPSPELKDRTPLEAIEQGDYADVLDVARGARQGWLQ